MFVDDDRGGLVMIRRELVRTRKCSSNLLFFTLVYRRYVSKPRYGSLAFPASSVPACLHVPPYLPYPAMPFTLPPARALPTTEVTCIVAAQLSTRTT